MTNTAPTYNIKVVLKETGLAADTLRAWERRYGLPTPVRSAGGHRLYSQRDIDTIKWLVARQAEGLSISRAVDLWNEQTSSGTDPLADIFTPGPGYTTADTLGSHRSEWVSACMAFNEYLAEKTLNQAFGLFPLEAVCTEVLQRGLSELGDMWYRNEASVEQEHFATALAQRKLETLITAAPPPVHSQLVLMGSTPGEGHYFSLVLLTLLMRRRGFPVIYLGANVPFMQLDKILSQVKPALVVLAAQQLITAAPLYEVAKELSRFDTKIAYGGRIFSLLPELRARIPAHFLGETIEAALQTMELLLTTNTGTPQIETISIRNAEIAEQFQKNRTLIDLSTVSGVDDLDLPYHYLHTALQGLGDNIYSAVSLGYMDALNVELDWIIGFMEKHKVEPTILKPFINTYARSIEEALGQTGQEITDWLISKAVI
jgi:DNA-binding transcriptional MerR regulator